jgi:hypothetical protein
MLNPSTADDRVDDPTIRRCMGFARRENCGGIIVVNLYGLRATSPKELLRSKDPYGPKNDDALTNALDEADFRGKPVVCAWGAGGGTGATRFMKLVGDSRATLVALGTTKDGHPRHPLYVHGEQPLISFSRFASTEQPE